MTAAVLSVVVPAHNSGRLIDATAARLADRLRGTEAEVIVVENGSTDDTWERCTKLMSEWDVPAVRFHAIQSERGMGRALRAGVLASSGAHVLLTADDLPFGFDDLDGFERVRARDGAAPRFLVGSKAHPESVVQRGMKRGVMTWAFSTLCRVVLGMQTRDPQGTLLVDGGLARRLCESAGEERFLFSTELVHMAEKAGVYPVEVPVRLADDHMAHASRVSLSDVGAMAFGLLRLRLRHRRLGRVVS